MKERHAVRGRSFAVICIGVLLLCMNAHAQNERDGRGENRDDRRGANSDDRRGERIESQSGSAKNNWKFNWGEKRGDRRGEEYHYRNKRWYRSGWFGWEYAVDSISVGARIIALPPKHRIIVVKDRTYYYDEVRYYQLQPDGMYLVVQAP